MFDPQTAVTNHLHLGASTMMENQDLIRFFKRFNQDRAFREGVIHALRGKSGAGAAKVVSGMARRYDYHFTPDEYLASRDRALAYDDDSDTNPYEPAVNLGLWQKVRRWLNPITPNP